MYDVTYDEFLSMINPHDFHGNRMGNHWNKLIAINWSSLAEEKKLLFFMNRRKKLFSTKTFNFQFNIFQLINNN